MSFEQCQHITTLMSRFNKPWFFAGGWAIDLYIVKETRVHSDIEIAVFRKDQIFLKDYLKDWQFKKIIEGECYNWENEFLELPVHEIHALNRFNGKKLEILLNEKDEN